MHCMPTDVVVSNVCVCVFFALWAHLWICVFVCVMWKRKTQYHLYLNSMLLITFNFTPVRFLFRQNGQIPNSLVENCSTLVVSDTVSCSVAHSIDAIAWHFISEVYQRIFMDSVFPRRSIESGKKDNFFLWFMNIFIDLF